jgi:phage gp29-like protein
MAKAKSPLQSALDMRPGTPSSKSKSRLGYERQTISTLDIPIQTFGVWDSVQLVQAALADLEQGTFLNAAILVDAMGRDDRISATLSSRVNGLLALRLTFRPGIDNGKGIKIADDLEASWPQMFPDGELARLLKWGRMVGAAPGELTWSTVDAPKGGAGKRWLPQMKVWHPQFMQWRWDWRDYSLVTMSDGIQRIETGTAHWTLYTPQGRYPAWQDGLVRALAIPFLIRWWAYRDWARYSEKHGLPIFKAKVPKGADERIKDLFFNSLSALGNENTVKLETGDPDQGDFDIDLLEPTANTWEGFRGLIEQCNSSIAILLLGQNLTTEVKGGSLAASSVHERVRADFLSADAQTLATFIREQILKPWAAFNYGDPELAPYPSWAVDPPEDTQKTAQTYLALGQAIAALKTAGAPIDVRAILEQQGVPMVSEQQQLVNEKAERVKMALDGAAAGDGSGDGSSDGGGEDGSGDGSGAGTTDAGANDAADDSDGSGDGSGDGADDDAAQREARLNEKKDPPLPKAAVEGQLYADALTDASVAQAAQVLGPDIVGLANDIGASTDYEDLRRRLLTRHAHMDRKPLAKLVEKAIRLAEMAGKFAVRKEIIT